MKFKLISTISALTLASGAVLASTPLMFNDNGDKVPTLNSMSVTNDIIHTNNVQIVDSVNNITIENFKVHNNITSSAIVNNNGKQEIYVWGNNQVGQLGLGDKLPRLTPTKLPADKLGNYTRITQISITSSSCFAIVQTAVGQQIYVWGANSYGQLGIGTSVDVSTPELFDTTRLGEYAAIKKIAISANGSFSSHMILETIDKKDQIFVWGQNNYALGLGTTEMVTEPTSFDMSVFGLFNKIKSFTLGNDFSSYAWLATNEGDKIFVWGTNSKGQLGTGTTNNVPTPQLFGSAFLANATIKNFGINDSSSQLILSRDNKDELYVWGDNQFGQLGINSTAPQYSPVKSTFPPFNSNISIIDLYVGKSSFMVCRINGTILIYTWGLNTNGQLGVNDSTNKPVPALFNPVTQIPGFNYTGIISTSLSTSYIDNTINMTGSKSTMNNFVYYNTSQGKKLYTWGYNNYGQLGIGSTTQVNVPTLANHVGEIKSIYLSGVNGQNLNVRTEVDGVTKYYICGRNDLGQYGNAKTTASNTLTEILLTKVTDPKPIISEHKLTASDAFDIVNPSNVLSKTELAKYVDLSSFPADAILSIDNTINNVDFENGKITFGIKTNKYDDLLVPDTITANRTYSVEVSGFKAVTGIDKKPIVGKTTTTVDLNITQLLDKTLSNNIVTDRALFAQYFDLSNIPAEATIYVLRTSFDKTHEATFNIKSTAVYDAAGKLKTNLLNPFEFNTILKLPQFNWAIIIGVSGGAGVLLILGISVWAYLAIKRRRIIND